MLKILQRSRFSYRIYMLGLCLKNERKNVQLEQEERWSFGLKQNFLELKVRKWSTTNKSVWSEKNYFVFLYWLYPFRQLTSSQAPICLNIKGHIFIFSGILYREKQTRDPRDGVGHGLKHLIINNFVNFLILNFCKLTMKTKQIFFKE